MLFGLSYMQALLHLFNACFIRKDALEIQSLLLLFLQCQVLRSCHQSTNFLSHWYHCTEESRGWSACLLLSRQMPNPYATEVFLSYLILSYLILSYLPRSLADCWGTTVDFTTSFLHSSRFSAFRSMIFHSRPVHSLMLSSHRFLCLPLRLPP